MNTILFFFIDIIAVQTDIPARQQKIYAVYSDLSGALFEFSWNFRKGHRFFVFQEGGRKIAQSLKRAPA